MTAPQKENLMDTTFVSVASGVLVLALCTVIWLLSRILHQLSDGVAIVDLTPQINQLRQAAEHYTDVSAVVAMIHQLDELDHDARLKLESYPEVVRAAAWLHYINTLGSDLQAAQMKLSDAHQGKDHWAIVIGVHNQEELIAARQQHVDNLRAKLDKAIELSGQPTGPRAV